MWALYFVLAVSAVVIPQSDAAARLVCYANQPQALQECSHIVYDGAVRGDKLHAILKEFRKINPRAKIVIRVSDVETDLKSLLKSKYVQGLEIHDAHKTLNRTKVQETVDDARTAISASGGGPLFLALPAHPELLAKYYDLRALMKKVDFMMVQTHDLGRVKKMTYHPSRLSGLWDMMNTDSVVDLAVGLGVPASKIIISLLATAQQFTLTNETLSTPGSPTMEDEPKEIAQDELCRQLQKGRWTLERDQDLSAPYAFKNTTWIAFEDSSSVDVKGKYARVRGLAGLALYRADRDVDTPCGPTLRTALGKVLNQQSRAPRAAILRSLEHEILSAPSQARALDALQVSPYRITQIVDSDGVIHSIREDTRTEFSCSRQGYFVHPRSCARFYRCVKFDQLSPEYTVFEFDCPAGLAFDSRYEVCVWPGSLPDSQACPGSSEIAPVPRTRFICPEHEGYYADPENCRWFFACLDHGKAPLTAYEFRCPFGLGFDAERLKCDWPWLVPACGNIARYEAEVHGYSGALLTGAAGFQGQTADSVNIAAHQSLISGASLNNHVGVQGGFLTQGDALDSNFIASQELDNAQGSHAAVSQGTGLAYQTGSGAGLVQATKYDDGQKYTSGSLILDDYRLPTKNVNAPKNAALNNAALAGIHIGAVDYSGTYAIHNARQANGNYNSNSASYAGNAKNNLGYQSSGNNVDNSGAYVHDPTGDYAEPYNHQGSPVVPYNHEGSPVVPYNHEGSPVVPYNHEDAGYKASSDKGSSQSGYEGRYSQDKSGQYAEDNSGAYVEKSDEFSGSYDADYSGSYNQDNFGQYAAGVYKTDSHIGATSGATNSADIRSYSQANSGNYLSDSKAYTGTSHILTAGAVNVGLVGKTTLVDADYNNQNNYQVSQGYYQSTVQGAYPGEAKLVSQPAVSIKHVGTDLNGYSFVTTPTSSGIPTTATPFAFTTVAPTVAYKATFVPEPPKSTVKQIFGFSQPAVTTVRPTVVAVQQYNTPNVQVTNHNEGINYGSGFVSESGVKQSSGYDYSKPSIKFEDGISYTTAAPAITVSKLQPSGFSYNQQTNQESVGFQYENAVPVTEEPFKKLVAYTTGPSITTFAQPTEASFPQSYSHQTLHKVEANNVQVPIEQGVTGYSGSVTYEQPQTVVQYSTPAPAVSVQPAVSTYQPQIVSQQTLHKVDANRVNTYNQDSSSGYNYERPTVQFEEGQKVQTYSTPATVVQYSTPAPAVVSTYKPPVSVYENPYLHILQYTLPKITPVQSYSYEPSTEVQYTTSQPAFGVQPFVSTYQPQVVSQQSYHKVDASQVQKYAEFDTGYQYTKPKQIEPQTLTYSTVAPAVISTYKPKAFSQKTFHKVESKTYLPPSSTALPPVSIYQNPILTYTQKPVTYVRPTSSVFTQTYQPALQTQEINHGPPGQSQGLQYLIQNKQFNEGYAYSQPEIQALVETGQRSYSDASLVSEQFFNLGTKNKYNNGKDVVFVSTTPANLAYEEHYSKYDTTKTYKAPEYVPPKTEYQQTYSVVSSAAPAVQQTYIAQNKNVDFSQYSTTPREYLPPSTTRVYLPPPTTTRTYSSPAPLKLPQLLDNTYLQPSSTARPIVKSTITYKASDYLPPVEAKTSRTYKAPEYVPPKTEYQQTYSVVSSAAPAVQQTYIAQNKKVDFSQQFDSVQNTVPAQVSFSTSHISQPTVESVHFSNNQYQKNTYDNPKIEIQYKAEAYLTPVVSTETPAVTTTYRPRTYSTTYSKYDTTKTYKAPEYVPPKTEYEQTYSVVSSAAPAVQQTYIAQNKNVDFSQYSTTPREYLPPSTTREYLPPTTTTRKYSSPAPHKLPQVLDNIYLPPSSTARPIVKSTITYKASDYIPPVEAKFVNFESFGYDNLETGGVIGFNHDQEVGIRDIGAKPYRKPNIVVETAKSNLLGFGTVGPDAGLVSPVTYTTAAPIAISSTFRPIVKSTTQEPTFKYVESTTAYKAPEYLPPSEETKIALENYNVRNEQLSNINYNPYQEYVSVSTTAPPKRKQNIVVQTAKANSGYESYVTDTGSAVTYSTPIVTSTESYATPVTISSTYAPLEQGLFEVTQAPLPRRRTKPKVAVVTKINDFNPLLVRKLGAVCSCQSQSPILVLKGTKINKPTPTDFDDYSIDYEDGRGDINENQSVRKSAITASQQVVTSTINPIIVRDDSYYQDFVENSNYDVSITPKPAEVVVSSTPVVTVTEKVVRIRPRVKAVTAAPTYQTVLLNQEVAPTPSAVSDDVSQPFDRYGPGGLRSRDETLQGSVDCQRAGLFRHPKQCNKFYACRWDCTKQRFTLHVFNCPVQLSFDPSIGACNWPSQGPACQGDTLLTNTL